MCFLVQDEENGATGLSDVRSIVTGVMNVTTLVTREQIMM